MSSLRPLAVVTGASSGLGYELAKLCVEHGHDLAIAANDRSIVEAKQAFEGMGSDLAAVQTDLSTEDGVQDLIDPEKVAKTGFDAMMKGEGDVVAGFMTKVQAAVAAVTPQSGLAGLHRGMAEPGSGKK